MTNTFVVTTAKISHIGTSDFVRSSWTVVVSSVKRPLFGVAQTNKKCCWSQAGGLIINPLMTKGVYSLPPSLRCIPPCVCPTEERRGGQPLGGGTRRDSAERAGPTDPLSSQQCCSALLLQQPVQGIQCRPAYRRPLWSRWEFNYWYKSASWGYNGYDIKDRIIRVQSLL